MNQYTKEEWNVSSKTLGDSDVGADIVIRAPNGLITMAYTIHFGIINAEANARLIAGAPAMYEALKLIASCPVIVDGDVVSIARKALAKVEEGK